MNFGIYLGKIKHWLSIELFTFGDPWRGRQLLSDLNEAIWWALKQADITIAFPQLDVHLDPLVEESLRSVAVGSEL